MGCHYSDRLGFYRTAHNRLFSKHPIKNLFQENKVQKGTFAD
jgi:hypothetical protein